MSMDSASNVAVIGVLGTCVAALIWVIKHLFTKILPVLDKLVEVTQENTKATKSADEYLRQRNGRDIKFHSEMLEELKTNSASVTKELKRVGDLTAKRTMQAKAEREHQTVIEQHVQHQVVESSQS